MHIPWRRVIIEQSTIGILLYRINQKTGRQMLPPHILKQKIVKDYAHRYSLSTLVETGTYLGDMVSATRRRFRRIISIELDDKLWRDAKDMFAQYQHISIVKGDSSQILPSVLASIDEPCLFWLDAHFSGGVTKRGDVETPIMRELAVILDRRRAGDVILIDDARLFVGKNDYPTVQQLRDLVAKSCPEKSVLVEDDVIRICEVGNSTSRQSSGST